MTLLGYFWYKWPYFAGKLSLDITDIQVNSALHPSDVDKSSTSLGWGEGGKVTVLYMACVIFCSGEVISSTNCYIGFTLLYMRHFSKNCVVLASAVLSQYTRVTDRQTTTWRQTTYCCMMLLRHHSKFCIGSVELQSIQLSHHSFMYQLSLALHGLRWTAAICLCTVTTAVYGGTTSELLAERCNFIAMSGYCHNMSSSVCHL